METLQSVPRDKVTLDHFQILLSLEGKEEVEREVICFRWVPWTFYSLNNSDWERKLVWA